jgi:hypothetical protein
MYMRQGASKAGDMTAGCRADTPGRDDTRNKKLLLLLILPKRALLSLCCWLLSLAGWQDIQAAHATTARHFLHSTTSDGTEK